MDAKQKPEARIRYASIEGAVWENEGEKGKFYNATLSKRFRQGEEWKSTNSFSEADLPTVSKVALDLHSVIQGLKLEKEE